MQGAHEGDVLRVRLDADAQQLVGGVDLEELALQRVDQQLHERVERGAAAARAR